MCQMVLVRCQGRWSDDVWKLLDVSDSVGNVSDVVENVPVCLKKVSHGVRNVSDSVGKVSDCVKKVSYGVGKMSDVVRMLSVVRVSV